jgi:hypothetical protein
MRVNSKLEAHYQQKHIWFDLATNPYIPAANVWTGKNIAYRANTSQVEHFARILPIFLPRFLASSWQDLDRILARILSETMQELARSRKILARFLA